MVVWSGYLEFIKPMNILHLSDLHFGTTSDATRWHSQLADDLRQLLSKLEPTQNPHLDALILSGDIANKSLPEEYEAARLFLNYISQDFGLRRSQIVIVPGNHDLNWELSRQAYTPKRRTDYRNSLDDRDIFEQDLIVDANYIEVPDPTQYEQRFKHFSDFYEKVIGNPYPQKYKQQYELRHFPEQSLLVLGLNSAWKLNHDQKYRDCASINLDALTSALNEINENPTYKNSRLKIAVWHHPLNSPFEDRIKEHDFMQRLEVNGFRLALHGHIHRAGADNYRYRLGIPIEIIVAGTFGAPVREWVPGYPLQYNLLKWQGDKLTVYTRKRIERDGAWQPDSMWVQEDGMSAKACYEVELEKKEFSKGSSPQNQMLLETGERIVKPTKSIEIFFSYSRSHQDKKLLDSLEKNLSGLSKQGLITCWHAGKIGIGQDKLREINEHLSSAQIILLLITPDFMKWYSQDDVEVNKAMERVKVGKACAIPILLETAEWSGTPFSNLQPLPKEGEFVDNRRFWAKQNQAFSSIAKDIRIEVERIINSSS